MGQPSREIRTRKNPPVIGSLLIVWLFFRLVLARARELVPDEAYYWTWSRHLAWGYLDHPPMVAWLIRAGTWLAGTNELGVRTASAFLATGTIGVVAALTKKMSPAGSAGAATLAVIILVASPLMAILGVIATPDTPACFFSVCAMACAAGVFLSDSQRLRSMLWLAFGLFWGLALLSKYPSILVGLAVFFALLSHPDGRRELKRVWACVGVLIAFLVFSPVLAWNASHHWESFLFQLHHGSASDAPISPVINLLKYAGGQAGIWTPVLFAAGCGYLIQLAMNFRQVRMPERILFFSAVIPLIFFGITSIRREPEANWPCFAYLPLTILLATYAWENRASQWYGWTKIGIIVAAGAMVMVQIPEIMDVIPPKIVARVPGRWRDLYGWQSLARAVDVVRSDAPVYASSYETASELSFYLPDQPDVWNLFNDRPTAADDFPGRPDPFTQPQIVFVRNWPAGPYEKAAGPLPKELTTTFNCDLDQWFGFALNRAIRAREIVVATHK